MHSSTDTLLLTYIGMMVLIQDRDSRDISMTVNVRSVFGRVIVRHWENMSFIPTADYGVVMGKLLVALGQL